MELGFTKERVGVMGWREKKKGGIGVQQKGDTR